MKRRVMILTGKALEDFNKWKVNNKNLSTIEVLDFKYLSEISRNSLIIEWFDSIGFYIEIGLIHKEDNIKAFTFSLSFQDYFAYCDKEFSSRREVLSGAIINVNEVYNKYFGN